jgi:Tfp pilus assembly protein PilF
MAPTTLDSLRSLCGGPRDGALLRLSLAMQLLAQADAPAAVTELRHALRFDPAYSAAWKLLGKTLVDTGDIDEAIAAYRQGIAAATERGDVQAGKELGVFLRRLLTANGAGSR